MRSIIGIVLLVAGWITVCCSGPLESDKVETITQLAKLNANLATFIVGELFIMTACVLFAFRD